MKVTSQDNRSHRSRIADTVRAEGFGDYEVNEALTSWEATQKLIPPEYAEMEKSDKCYLCAGTPNEKTGYAHTIMAHKEPAAFKALFGFGKPRLKAEVGSLLPVSVPVCTQCKKEIKKASWLKTVIMLGFLAVGVLIVAIGAPLMSSKNELMPNIIFYSSVIVFELIGLIVSRVVGDRYIKANQGKVHFHIYDIDLFAKMREMGWYLFQDNSAITPYKFDESPGDFGAVFDD